MGVLTTLLKLLKPGENDYYNQQTEQADNWDKVDDYAVLTNTDKNGIWGGDFGGYIQDPIPKELNKRYIDNINGKAFICIKAGDSSVVSNTTEYFTACNVVDNLDKLQNLNTITSINIQINTEYINMAKCTRIGNIIILNFSTQPNITIPQNFPVITILDTIVEEQKFVVSDYQSSVNSSSRCSLTNNKVQFPSSNYKTIGSSYGQVITHVKQFDNLRSLYFQN